MKIKRYQEKEVGTGEITKEYADKIFEELLAFQGYGFCAAHAKAYSIYSAVQLWLQEHYFLEYMCVLLSHIDRAKEKKGIAILNERVEYCIKHGVTIHYPDVNKSNDKWQIIAGGLLAPLKNIKSISDRELNIISQNRPYKDLKDFLDKTQFNNKRFEVLLFAHAFDKFGKIEDLYNWYYNHYMNKDNEKKKEKDLFDEFGIEEEINESSYAETNMVTFSKVELDEKCMDLNGFVVFDNILIKYHNVYKQKISDLVEAVKDTKIGNSKIYQLEDLFNMVRGENSEPVWALAQIRNVATNLRTKSNKLFSKAIISDGITKLTIFIWRNYLPEYIKKGNVVVLPFKVFTDPEIKENRISFAEWMEDKCDIPIIEEAN